MEILNVPAIILYIFVFMIKTNVQAKISVLFF